MNEIKKNIEKLIFTTKGYKKKKITHYNALTYESAHTHNKLLNVIQRVFDKANKAFGKVHLQTLMPKLQKHRQKRNRLSAHIFEDKLCDVNLDLKVHILLDIEKAIT